MASTDPLHGITLEIMVKDLVDHLGWEEMGYRIPIRCFTHDPSVSSSLKFLRRTPWARGKVEELYQRETTGRARSLSNLRFPKPGRISPTD